MAGAMKKAGYAIESFKSDKGERTYQINPVASNPLPCPPAPAVAGFSASGLESWRYHGGLGRNTKSALPERMWPNVAQRWLTLSIRWTSDRSSYAEIERPPASPLPHFSKDRHLPRDPALTSHSRAICYMHACPCSFYGNPILECRLRARPSDRTAAKRILTSQAGRRGSGTWKTVTGSKTD
jgi:hypothetical protein